METYPGIGAAIVMIPIFAVIGWLFGEARSRVPQAVGDLVERKPFDAKEEQLWRNYVFARDRHAYAMKIGVPDGSGDHVYEERHKIVSDARRAMERARAEYDAYCAKEAGNG